MAKGGEDLGEAERNVADKGDGVRRTEMDDEYGAVEARTEHEADTEPEPHETEVRTSLSDGELGRMCVGTEATEAEQMTIVVAATDYEAAEAEARARTPTDPQTRPFPNPLPASIP
ncbi:hypothetical protein V5O48_018517 [Marasmius crinis-equi]|uniref:Uncharacterized protein n=1 Tax=Marasmius crinis-equi TaxID=585013 RepID=A0ABR3EL19_9AGAR